MQILRNQKFLSVTQLRQKMSLLAPRVELEKKLRVVN